MRAALRESCVELAFRLIAAVWDDWATLPARSDDLAKSDVYTLRRILPSERGLSW